MRKLLLALIAGLFLFTFIVAGCGGNDNNTTDKAKETTEKAMDKADEAMDEGMDKAEDAGHEMMEHADSLKEEAGH